LATLERLLSLLSAFEVVVWMTDGWPLYESRLNNCTLSASDIRSALSDNLNLRQHWQGWDRKSLSFSKSVDCMTNHRALSEHKTLSVS
jgi:insertion element IS1 protein InsB